MPRATPQRAGVLGAAAPAPKDGAMKLPKATPMPVKYRLVYSTENRRKYISSAVEGSLPVASFPNVTVRRQRLDITSEQLKKAAVGAFHIFLPEVVVFGPTAITFVEMVAPPQPPVFAPMPERMLDRKSEEEEIVAVASSRDGTEVVALMSSGNALQMRPTMSDLYTDFSIPRGRQCSHRQWSESFRIVGRYLILMLPGEVQISTRIPACNNKARRLAVEGRLVASIPVATYDAHLFFLNADDAIISVISLRVEEAPMASTEVGCRRQGNPYQLSFPQGVGEADALQLVCTGDAIAGTTTLGVPFVVTRKRQPLYETTANAQLSFCQLKCELAGRDVPDLGQLVGTVPCGLRNKEGPVRLLLYFMVPMFREGQKYPGVVYIAEVRGNATTEGAADVTWRRLQWSQIGLDKRNLWRPLAFTLTTAHSCSTVLTKDSAVSVLTCSDTLKTVMMESFRELGSTSPGPSSVVSTVRDPHATIAATEAKSGGGFFQRVQRIFQTVRGPSTSRGTEITASRSLDDDLNPPQPSEGAVSARTIVTPSTGTPGSARGVQFPSSARSAGSGGGNSTPSTATRIVVPDALSSDGGVVRLLLKVAEFSEIALSDEEVRGCIGLPAHCAVCKGHRSGPTASAVVINHVAPATFLVWFRTEMFEVTVMGCSDVWEGVEHRTE